MAKTHPEISQADLNEVREIGQNEIAEGRGRYVGVGQLSLTELAATVEGNRMEPSYCMMEGISAYIYDPGQSSSTPELGYLTQPHFSKPDRSHVHL